MSWKDLMSNFVEFEGKKEEVPVSKLKEHVASLPSQTAMITGLTGTIGTSTATVVSVGAVDTKPFEDKILSKLKSDPVYSKLLETLDSLHIAGIDEGQAFKAALTLLEKQGVSYAQVKSSIIGLAGSLAAESSHFSDVLGTQRANEVQVREKKIQDLGTQIQALKDQQTALASEVLEQKNKLNAVEAGFTAAKAKIAEEIGDMERKLNLYSPASNQTTGGK